MKPIAKTKTANRGFSLVELLVAMVILSLIVLVSTQSFALFTQRWDGRLKQFDDRFDQLRARWVVRDLLTSLHPFVVKNPDGRDRFYFEGNRNGFVAVASQSAFDSRIPAVVRLSFVIAKGGKYDLIYEEWPMVTDQLRTTTQLIPWSEPVLLADNVSAPDFAYFGVPKAGRGGDVQQLGTDQARWLNDYNSLQTFFHPKAVQLSWLGDDGPVSWSIPLIQPAPGLIDMLAEGAQAE